MRRERASGRAAPGNQAREIRENAETGRLAGRQRAAGADRAAGDDPHHPAADGGSPVDGRGTAPARTRAAVSDENAAGIDQRFLGAIESIRNELSDQDLSSRLSAFFNSFSELANNPTDEAVRTVVVQQGSGLATSIRELRAEHANVRTEIDRALATIRLLMILVEIGRAHV